MAAHRAPERRPPTRHAAGKLLGDARVAAAAWPILADRRRPRARAARTTPASCAPPSDRCAEHRGDGRRGDGSAAVGTKAPAYFRFRASPSTQSFSGFVDRPTFDDARAIAAVMARPFVAGEVDQVRDRLDPLRVGRRPGASNVRQLLPLAGARGRTAAPTTAGHEPGHARGLHGVRARAREAARRAGPRAARGGDLRRAARGRRRRSTRPSSGPWPPPPRTPTSSSRPSRGS